MKKWAYYNEKDPFAAAWIRELMKRNLIAKGEVDERSIVDVRPEDVRDFCQCHYFAGVAVWSYALRQAGWPDDRQVWTGSCPCQPFSSAGKGQGFKDERHLWPEFYRLISQCRPATCFGEQVASKDGLAWLDLVQADMEDAYYAFGAVDICCASFGAPHIRQRLYWVGSDTLGDTALWGCVRGEMGNEAGPQCPTPGGRENEGCWRNDVADDGACVRLADTAVHGHLATKGPPHVRRVEQFARWEDGQGECLKPTTACSAVPWGLERPCANPTNGFWRDADWILCRDGKWRAVEPGTFPLANGAPARVGRLRGYGNAINAEQAKAFIEAFMEVN